MSGEKPTETSRRDFLRTAAVGTAATAVATSMPTTAEGMRRVLGANDRIAIGHIGLGIQGYNAHVNYIQQAEQDNKTQQIAVCDLYGRRAKKAAEKLKLKESQIYPSYKKVLDLKDVDAVVIATSDNWHATIAIDALNAGKHVYVEKPLTRTTDEIFALYDTVKKTGKKLQVGAQRCTNPKYKAVSDLVKTGKYGKVIVGQATFMRNVKEGVWDDYLMDLDCGPKATGDAYVDWETFRKGQGPTEWDPDRFFRWRKYYAYGSGLIGDLFPHYIHPLILTMNMPLTGNDGWPRRVSCGGGLYVQKYVELDRFTDPDRQNLEKAYLAKFHPGKDKVIDREIGDFVNMSVDFDNASLMMMSSSCNEEGWPMSLRLSKATINFGSSKIQLKPERVWSDEVDDYSAEINGEDDNIPAHHKNFFEAIRNNTEPAANIDLAARAQVAICLAERSFRESKTFTFDPATRKITG